ncbi:uncharacterized protein Z519_10066 [Cladophialophora bantiana CBS 173.52]|uniref:Heterokaryon incompatibility domain-containing protein n=1 Tax=Cladophialophora bantiana (strain ATCC 10958 / CBS 173.52 / CDC B-1940 / NIH 8579) TaxID=1442370 RepID=A0A0D2H7C4_CLAB1|nr:uncharacterized protein Z519_10066 [Cladophialophora bantiana CBS 173.52]KIW89213.1 hypothetical protein Z519_10066 [Cladophialophora bantiana CBS 173.52]
MDFIPPVTNPAHPRFSVPYFSPPSSTYTAGGLESWLFYPHYEGFNIQHIVEGNFHGKTWLEAAAFIQRWAYLGMIAEIMHIGGLRGLRNEFITEAERDAGTEQLRIFSALLPYNILLWNHIHPDLNQIDADQENIKRFLTMSVILKRVNVFYNLLTGREWVRPQRVQNQNYQPRHVHSKHDHRHDHRAGWTEWLQSAPENQTFFTDEPYSGVNSLESPGHALVLSIGVVGELLSDAVERKYKRRLDLKWNIPVTIVRRMDLAGWCPVWLRKFKDEGSVIRPVYLSSISKGPTHRHASCCFFGCIANQIDKSTYTTKHCRDDCNCDVVSFDLGDGSEYARWIRDGYAPLLLRENSRTAGRVSWKLVRSHEPETSAPKRYVAISHVWADGTGNAGGNALPSCQLQKFQDAVIKLFTDLDVDEQVPFWVDTICVPFNDSPVKMLALRDMERIYREADRVLVFDSTLMQISLDTPARECLTRIEISPWNERLWTIQEAAFAKVLAFQFKDGLASLPWLAKNYRLERFANLAQLRYDQDFRAESVGMAMLKLILDMHLGPVLKDKNAPMQQPPGVQSGMWLALDADALDQEISDVEMEGLTMDSTYFGTLVAVLGFFSILQLPAAQSNNVRTKWSSLEKVLPYRQTSIIADEGLCLATLLGMDLTTFHNLKDEERIRLMFLKMEHVSTGILFGSRPRLQQSGYRWMPVTFVGERTELSEQRAHVTQQGIRAILPGLAIDFPPGGRIIPWIGNRRLGFIEIPEDDDDGPGHLVAASFPIHLAGTDQAYIVDLMLPEGNAGFIAPGSKVHIVLESLLVPDDPPDEEHSPIKMILKDWELQNRKSLIEAFLVDDTNVEGDVLKVTYRVAATLSRYDSPTASQLETAAVATQIESQEWLIS